ncbi:MAG: hypothetical protein AB7R89_01810 [Dehalococcoidia bacterium]
MVMGRRHSAATQNPAAERAATEVARPSLGGAVLHGIVGGLIAGVVFAMAVMVMAAILQGSMSAFWMPLRMIGAIVLGQEALMPRYSLLEAGAVGAILHMMLSAMFGLVFALAAWAVPALARSAGLLILAASIYGLLLWLVNFQIIAPVAGWDWFPNRANQFWQGFVAHTFFFGTVLGMYLAAVWPKRRAEPTS